MLGVKVKAVTILTLLIIAIGVPTIFYAMSVKGEINEKPVAIITGPQRSFVNIPVEFSGKNSKDNGFIVSYLWNFGDGHKSSGKYVNHTYLSVGNYTVTLTVYDNNGAINSTSKKIEIIFQEEKFSLAYVDDLLKNTEDYIGEEIKVHGIFAHGRNYSFYMVNESGYRGLRVYCEVGARRPDIMNYGDKIEVLARFTIYRGELELKVENNTKDYVIVIGHGGKNEYANISFENWENYNNSFVHFSGEVTALIRSYKFEMGSLWIYEEMNATSIGSPAVGDTFEIWGFLTYYKPKNQSGYNEVVIRAYTHDMAKYINSNYTDVTVSQILSSTEEYNNTSLHITMAFVTSEYASWKFWISDENNETIQVYVEKGGNIEGIIFSGAEVEVWGVLSSYKGIWEIKIRNVTEDMVIVLNKPTYIDASVPELLKNSSQYKNKSVHSWGVVSWLYENTSSGLTLFDLYYEGEKLTVVGFKGSNISYMKDGYWAEVYGTFTSYQGEWEIKIEPDSYDFAIGKPQNYSEVNITQILDNPLYYNNTLVYIPWSVITYVYNASWLFYVSNSTGNKDISVYVERGGKINGTPYKCAPVEIWGMVTQYQGSWEIKIRNSANDTVNVLKKYIYVDVNITTLIINLSQYNNTNVHIPNATVIDIYAMWLFWISNSSSNNDNITVYVGHGVYAPLLGKGDVVEIYGNVTLHNGTYEIKIRNCTPDRINVIYSNAKYVNFSYIHEVDSNGTLIHLGEQVIVNGTVIVSPDVYSFTTSTGTKILKFYIENQTGGVQVFGYLNYSQCHLSEGDVVQIRGTVDQYNGEAELKVTGFDYITLLNHTSPILPIEISTGLFGNWSNAEKIEGTLVTVNGTVTDKYAGSSFVKITVDDGTGGIVIFIRNSWGIDTSNISIGDNITVVGIVAQYDSSSPYTSGYEIMPRYQSDITKINSTKSEVGKEVKNKIVKSSNEVILKWKIDIVLTVEDMLVH